MKTSLGAVQIEWGAGGGGTPTIRFHSRTKGGFFRDPSVPRGGDLNPHKGQKGMNVTGKKNVSAGKQQERDLIMKNDGAAGRGFGKDVSQGSGYKVTPMCQQRGVSGGKDREKENRETRFSIWEQSHYEPPW